MTKTRADIIGYLMGRKFPYLKSVLAGQSLMASKSQIEAYANKRAEVLAYQAELEAMPDVMLRELNDRESEKERQQARIKADHEEKARFFNQPSADADYTY